MKKMLFLLSAVSVLSLQVTLAQLSDPVQLMDKSRDLTMSGNIQSTVSLTITEKNGAVRTRKLNMITKSYDDGTIKRMVKFLDPADVRGTAMLIVDNRNTQDDMWIYLPALKKTRRIVSTEKGKSFMSSEFSNADMSTGSNADFKICQNQGNQASGLLRVCLSATIKPTNTDTRGRSHILRWAA